MTKADSKILLDTLLTTIFVVALEKKRWANNTRWGYTILGLNSDAATVRRLQRGKSTRSVNRKSNKIKTSSGRSTKKPRCDTNPVGNAVGVDNDDNDDHDSVKSEHEVVSVKSDYEEVDESGDDSKDSHEDSNTDESDDDDRDDNDDEDDGEYDESDNNVDG